MGGTGAHSRGAHPRRRQPQGRRRQGDSRSGPRRWRGAASGRAELVGQEAQFGGVHVIQVRVLGQGGDMSVSCYFSYGSALCIMHEAFQLANQNREIRLVKMHVWCRNTVMFHVRGDVFVMGVRAL